MLEITNLNKTYANGVKALNGINLKIGKGMFGLLGPNGAGKSSLMRTIATLQDPDSGEVFFNKKNILLEKESLRTKLGYLPQEFGVYPNSTAEDLLNHLALLKGITDGPARKKSIDQLFELTNLGPHRKKNLGGFSGGMKQRFGIAQALLGQPELIIVDEPTAGLDPDERDRFHNLLSQIGENITVILSTHIVSDVSDLCQEMAIINNGTVLLQQQPEQAIKSLEGKIWKSRIDKSEAPLALKKYPVVSSRFSHGKVMIRVFSEQKPEGLFEPTQAELEDVYFSYIRSYLK